MTRRKDDRCMEILEKTKAEVLSNACVDHRQVEVELEAKAHWTRNQKIAGNSE